MEDKQVPDPAEEFEEMDLDNISYGFTEDDLEDVVDEIKGDRFVHSGKSCRVRNGDVESEEGESITKSRQGFWFAAVKVDWDEETMRKVGGKIFDDSMLYIDDSWIESRVGHERTSSREEAEDEAEWLAEQVVMAENDPRFDV